MGGAGAGRRGGRGRLGFAISLTRGRVEGGFGAERDEREHAPLINQSVEDYESSDARRRAMDAPAAALLALVVQSDAFFPERVLRFRRPTILATVSFDPSLLEVSQAFVPVGRLEVLVVVRV